MQQDMPQDEHQQSSRSNGERWRGRASSEEGQGGEEAPQGPEGMGRRTTSNELDQAEADTFSELKPDQFAIKIKELKQQYKSLVILF